MPTMTGRQLRGPGWVMTVSILLSLVWAIGGPRLLAPPPGRDGCPSLASAATLLGVQAGLALAALCATVVAGRHEGGRGWAPLACGAQILAFTLVGFYEIAAVGGFCPSPV